jgi:hypothetical protein
VQRTPTQSVHAVAESGEAAKLGLDSAAKLRLTAQQPFTVAPKPAPLRWRGFGALREVMVHYQALLSTLFWEALDLPLRELEQLKTLKVRGGAFFQECLFLLLFEVLLRHRVAPAAGSLCGGAICWLLDLARPQQLCRCTA